MARRSAPSTDSAHEGASAGGRSNACQQKKAGLNLAHLARATVHPDTPACEVKLRSVSAFPKCNSGTRGGSHLASILFETNEMGCFGFSIVVFDSLRWPCEDEGGAAGRGH